MANFHLFLHHQYGLSFPTEANLKKKKMEVISSPRNTNCVYQSLAFLVYIYGVQAEDKAEYPLEDWVSNLDSA